MLFILLILNILLIIFIKLYCVLTKGKCSSKCKLNGKVALVTGSNRGIGYFTALNLAKRGAKVIITSENFEDLKRAQKEMIKESGNPDIVAKHLNYLSLDGVRSFAKDIIDTEPRLDILVNNAGSFGHGHKFTKYGLLPVMQINYFAPFLLTNLLLGLLKKTQSSRIVNVASVASNFSFVFNPKNINSLEGLGQNTITELIEYFHSKICNVSWTIEMAKRLKGEGVTVNCLHPGMVYTDINLSRTWAMCLAKVLRHIITKTPEEGAETTIHLAACERVEGVTGKYYTDCRPSWVWTDLSAEVRNLIWEQSVRLSGLKSDEMLI